MKYTRDKREYYRQRYHKIRMNLIQQLGGRCVICGSTENLEFDHTQKEAKGFDIAPNITAGKDAIQEELKKCRLLCHSCHLKKTRDKKDAGAKLNKEAILNIRKEYATGNITQTELGKRYGITQSAVGRIVRKERWTDI